MSITVKKSMSSDLFAHELLGTGSVFGRKADVKIEIGGDKASADTTTIYLPEIGGGSTIEAEEQAIVRGFLDHEAGHIRHTHDASWQAHQQAFSKAGRQLASDLMNGLEDVRIERRVLQDYPGAAPNLEAAATAANKKITAAIKGGDEKMLSALQDIRQVGAIATTWAGRARYAGPAVADLLAATSPEVRAEVEDALRRLDSCENTYQVGCLANELAAKWREEPMPPNPPPPPGVSAGSGEGELEEGDEGEEGEEAGDFEGEEDSLDGGGGSPWKDDKAPPAKDKPLKGDDFKDAVEDALKDHGGRTKKYKPLTRALDMVHHRTLANEPAPKHKKYRASDRDRRKIDKEMAAGTRADYDIALSAVSSVVNVLRARLTRALLSTQRRDWIGGEEQGRLDSRRLVAASMGVPNVFRRQTDRVEMDTAVSVLIDLSGSMSGRKVAIAEACAIAISEALESAGVSFEVSGFCNVSSIDDGTTIPPGWSRVETLDIVMFKDYGEAYRDAKGAMTCIRNAATGNNTDGEFIGLAQSRLMAQPEKRKIMFVLSDGSPCAACTGGLGHHSHLLYAVKEVEKAGIALVGIGIQDSSVANYFQNFVVVESLSELGGASMGKLAEALMGARNAVSNTSLLASS